MGGATTNPVIITVMILCFLRIFLRGLSTVVAPTKYIKPMHNSN